jgi:hypothetical protein
MAFPHHTASYQPCETFFVESADDLNPRIDPKEQAKLIARERQYAIAEQLSTLAKEEYLDDCLSHMLQMDVSFLFSVSEQQI